MSQHNLTDKEKVILNINKLFLLVTVLAISPTLTAAPILQLDGSGQLTGAQNVDVNGTLYDVAFVDGSCASVFDGCDSISDFTFQGEVPDSPARVDGGAQDAAQALMDQVFIDNTAGLFDTEPELTLGCTSTLQCNIWIPFAVDSDGTAYFGRAFNTVDNNNDGVSNDLFFSSTLDLSGNDTSNTFATFLAPNNSTVPEPVTVVLLFIGLAGIGATRLKA